MRQTGGRRKKLTTAHELYSLFVGEIGFPRREFLHDLRWWEVNAIIRGYNRRSRNMWSAVRWQTYHLMSAQVGSENLHKSGINSPTDLLPFPWDTDTRNLPTAEEVSQLQAEIDAINAENDAINAENEKKTE